MAGGAFRRAASHGSGTAQLIMGPWGQGLRPRVPQTLGMFRYRSNHLLVVWDIVYFSIYIYIYIYIFIYTFIYIYILIHTHTHIYIYILIGKNKPNLANIFQRG